MTELAERFPLGAALDLAAFTRDPYPMFARMRAEEPVSWIPALNIFYATRYEDVVDILRDDETFRVGAEHMLVYDTFGKHMMTIDGAAQRRYRMAMRGPFAAKFIRQNLEKKIAQLVDDLIDGFARDGAVELRQAFANKLPVRTMLAVFGLPPEDEPLLRQWYDTFERALANYTWDEQIRSDARVCVGEFKSHLLSRIDALRAAPDESLLAALAATEGEGKLTDDEIAQNALIIFFGGISTVEALILNAFYVFACQPELYARVKGDRMLLPKALEEIVRWSSPVQAVTRYVANDTTVAGVALRKGDLVNCMIGSANRDERIFERPDEVDIDRPDLSRHIAFATGPHVCLGNQLARAEGRTAIERLLDRLPGLEVNLEKLTPPKGYEFRQPSALSVIWSA